MTVFMVPRDETYYPTLGPQVCAWMEKNLVHGPGDIRGAPARIDDEKRALIYRMYEVMPRGHERAGRRRFKRVGISLRKGTAKTELAAWLVAAELHPAAPVRCIGWTKRGAPIGGPVTDPYIPMVAYTVDQSEELAYGALLAILAESPVKDDFDIGLERVMRRDGDGKAVPLANAPNARDGARTTHQLFDETHRLVLPRLRAAHKTMLANIAKRQAADAWTNEITTAYAPGEGSIAEATMDYARAIADGRIKEASLFFFHREASEKHDIRTKEGLRAAIAEASGLALAYTDVDAIAGLFDDPSADIAYLERVWLNRIKGSSERAFDIERWRLQERDRQVQDKALITLGFDGSRRQDATALIATEIESGYQWPLGIWERPLNAPADWQIPVLEVDLAVTLAFQRFTVWRLYADPPYWESQVAEWAGRYGAERVVAWWTNQEKRMAFAVRGFENAITEGEVTHDGDAHFARHIANAVKRTTPYRDERDQPLYVIQKDRSDSLNKIDAAAAAVLSWQARNDAIASGAMADKKIVRLRAT